MSNLNYLDIICKNYKNIVTHLTFHEIFPLVVSCKKLNKIVDSDQTWKHLVDFHEMYWKWDQFEEQDTGSTSVRSEISDAYSSVSHYTEEDSDGNEILINAKGLVQFNVYRDRKYPYQICSLSGKTISEYIWDYPTNDDFE